MKIMKIKYNILMIALLLSFSSCNDWFDTYPQSETILEDYWQDENDVKSVVGSCYRAMNEVGFMERLVVWGESRSDNVIKGASDNTDLDRILNLTLNSTNPYTSWGDFYKTINYCNTVIYYAPTVREKDPNFTEGQLRAYLAEAKGVRALCYFTLVRTFRDIPFITEPTIDDSQSFEVPQSDPDEIINYLINDLKEIESSAVMEFDDNAHDKGRITRKTIWALIADMALWMNDYDTCISYCDKIISSGNNLTLDTSLNFYYNIFVLGNSNESLFELQFNSLLNYAVFEAYSSVSGYGRSGQNVYRLSAFDFVNKTTLFNSTDLRAKDFFIPIQNDGFFSIIKYVGYRQRINSTGTINLSDYTAMPCFSWIFYRLSDAYLMKAEALVERGSQSDLEAAFDLVSLVFDRANPELGSGSLSFSQYGSQLLMRNLVFDERQREFLFEGKRYFDLLRRIKREGTTRNVIGTYLIRKYTDLDQATVLSKINDKDAIYMPINNDELKRNTLLVQNPFYILSSDISKN